MCLREGTIIKKNRDKNNNNLWALSWIKNTERDSHTEWMNETKTIQKPTEKNNWTKREKIQTLYTNTKPMK